MYTTHRTMLIHSCAKHSLTMSKDKITCGQNTKSCYKPYKFEVKGQCRTRIIYVRDTLSHGDTLMYQIW